MEVAVAGYAEGVLKNSLGMLGSFLWNEALLVGSVRQDIQFIRDELLSMNGVLQDLICSGDLNHQTKAWMLQVLEVACDAELCTNDFMQNVGARHNRGFFAALKHYVNSLPTLPARRRIGKTIQELKSRAKEVSERRSRYNTTTKSVEDKNEYTSATYQNGADLVHYNHLLEEDVLVGMDTTKIAILMLGTSGISDLVVLVGPARSGKTTLARMLYRRSSSRPFPVIPTIPTAWVTVSEKLDLKRILEEILRQVMKSPPPRIEEYKVDQLSEKLREQIKDKRCHIFLDSLWTVEQWRVIKGALRDLSYRVVVTTRKKEVADECCRGLNETEIIRHEMESLQNEQLDQLFDKLIPHGRQKSNYGGTWFQLRSYALESCPEPLVVKCICGVVASVNMERSWICRLANDLTDVSDRLTSFEEKMGIELPARLTEKHEHVAGEVLKLCWSKYLPSQLQQCSQDLSNHQEGYVINSKKLMRQWIAKGFIKPGRGLSTEEVAENYFLELISRCIIEPESVLPGGRIRRCRINGVFKELITAVPNPSANPVNDQSSSKVKQEVEGASPIQNQKVPNPETETAAAENQPAFDGETINPVEKKQVPNPENSNLGMDQHVPKPAPISLQLYNVLNPSGNFVRKHLFSLNPKLLTFLDLEGCKGLINRELSKLCEFDELKFLSLRNTNVDHLPDKIGNLKLLETLDIRQSQIKKVNSGIVNLNRLKHLLAGYVYKPEGADFVSCPRAVEMPAGISQMQALHTLAHVNVTQSSEILFSVRELTQLKKLGVVIPKGSLINSRPLCISVMMLSASLCSLSISDEREGGSLDFLDYLCFPPQKLQSLNLRGNLGRLPLWVANHTRLTEITLSHTNLGSHDLKLLGGIQTLLCLKLYPDSFREHELVLVENYFKALQMLVVHCDGIRSITFENGATPSLEVFKWVMNNSSGKFIIGHEELIPMLKHITLIGNLDTGILNQFDKFCFIDDKDMVALEVIEKEIWDCNEDETEKETTKKNQSTVGTKLLGCFKQ